ncbi:nucleotidyltransferase family protein [Actinotignum timonense]|uniref:nucleotidyltransferase family protein n=1 Tax=Actinotignum timonense TaxID=1870995 RepID=UPI0038973769|nr:nucleotidyltransferase family protein [Gleimia europaea]
MNTTASSDSTQVPSLAQLLDSEEAIRDAIKAHCGTGRFWVFGSVARAEATTESDYDLLVEFLPGASYFDLIELEMKLSELLGKPVDVMSSKSQGYVADNARSEAILVEPSEA